MTQNYEWWLSTLGETGSLDDLKGARIGIDAAHYLRTRVIRNPGPPNPFEPLTPAHGGLPLRLRDQVESDLYQFRQRQIKPVFVFPGIDVDRHVDPFQVRREGEVALSAAWSIYERGDPDNSVTKFGESSYPQPEDAFRALQSHLRSFDADFFVAPYSSEAQLQCFLQENIVQAVAGPLELLLFACDRVIAYWDFTTAIHQTGTFRFISRSRCMGELKKVSQNGSLSDDQFIDALLLAGTHFFPTPFPPLDAGPRSRIGPKPIVAAELIMQSPGKSGDAVVQSHGEDAKVKELNYLDNYRRARLAVKHQPVLTKDGDLKPTLDTKLPNDAHEFLVQRLPLEIFHYVRTGFIDARILKWRTTSEIIESVPVDGGLSQDYQTLVSSKLTPLRTTAINLLSSSLHRWYQHKDLTLKCWFSDSTGKPYTTTILMRGVPESRLIVEKWNVKSAVYKEPVSRHSRRNLIGKAILTLQDSQFVAKSSSSKNVEDPLAEVDEILLNTTWRFLTLRDYVDLNHELTAWGKMLVAVINALEDPKLEEAAIVAVELLRLGMLNWDADMFPYAGAPGRGDAQDKKYNLLISRVAGLSSLRHQQIGYTGPLSRHLLGYNSVINAVRSRLRDLVEVTATQMFLSACAKRDIKVKDMTQIAMSLPFLGPVNSLLSVAVKTYLDELATGRPKEDVQDDARRLWFPRAEDLLADMETAFKLFDAVNKGVQASGNLVKESEKQGWKQASEWLAKRR